MKKIYEHIGIGLIDKNYKELNPLTFGYETCRPSHTAYGWRDYYLIHYVESGYGTLYRKGKAYRLSAGQIFIISPQEDVRYVADEHDPWCYVWIGFRGDLAKRFSDLDEPVTNADSTPFDMLRALSERSDMREETAAAALFLIYADVFSGKQSRPHYVKRIVDTVNTLYMNDISVAQLAEELGLDRRYVSRLFHKTMGMSIKDYIIKVRMDAAKKLLKAGRGVSQTAELVGYSDAFNFSKMFKKHCGVSPSAFAKAQTAPEQLHI